MDRTIRLGQHTTFVDADTTERDALVASILIDERTPSRRFPQLSCVWVDDAGVTQQTPVLPHMLDCDPGVPYWKWPHEHRALKAHA